MQLLDRVRIVVGSNEHSVDSASAASIALTDFNALANGLLGCLDVDLQGISVQKRSTSSHKAPAPLTE